MHVYMATPKESVGPGRGEGKGTRYFARAASEVVGRGKRYFMEQVCFCAVVYRGLSIPNDGFRLSPKLA